MDDEAFKAKHEADKRLRGHIVTRFANVEIMIDMCIAAAYAPHPGVLDSLFIRELLSDEGMNAGMRVRVLARITRRKALFQKPRFDDLHDMIRFRNFAAHAVRAMASDLDEIGWAPMNPQKQEETFDMAELGRRFDATEDRVSPYLLETATRLGAIMTTKNPSPTKA